jgi:hypothetical protein
MNRFSILEFNCQIADDTTARGDRRGHRETAVLKEVYMPLTKLCLDFLSTAPEAAKR